MAFKYFNVLKRAYISLLAFTGLLTMTSVSFGISKEGSRILERLQDAINVHHQALVLQVQNPTEFGPDQDNHPSAQFNHIEDYTHMRGIDGEITVRALVLPQPIQINQADAAFLEFLREIFADILFSEDNELKELWNQLVFRVGWLTEGVRTVALAEVLEAWLEFLEGEENIEEAVINFTYAHQQVQDHEMIAAIRLMTTYLCTML